MNRKRVKVAVTGAGGQIGYSLLFRIASGQAFGPDVDVELSLLERESVLSVSNGVVMELNDCAFPLLKNITCTSDLTVAMKDANWVVLVGAVPRKAGMERSDLLEINGSIFTSQGKAINDYAADDVGVLVVGNPCNTNCLIAMNNAPDVPNHRFYALTMLDELRAKYQLAARAGVDVTAVTNMTIWGNHSATQYPDFYNAKINDRSAADVIADEAWLQNDFISTVQQRGAEVIKARGSSSAASAANAVIVALHSLTHDTPAGDSYSMCTYSNGEYGVDEGLIFSFPCRTQNGEVQIIEGISQNEFGSAKLQATLDELRSEYQAVKSMGLIE